MFLTFLGSGTLQSRSAAASIHASPDYVLAAVHGRRCQKLLVHVELRQGVYAFQAGDHVWSHRVSGGVNVCATYL